MGETAEPEQREAEWLAEQPEEEVPDDMTAEQQTARNEEHKKQSDLETEEVTTMAKRKGYKLFIHGSNFMNTKQMMAKFTWDDKVSHLSYVVFKNSKLLGTIIPDLGAEVPEGDHLVTVQVTLNGQQYAGEKIQFLYKSVDPNLTEEDLKRMDEEDAKGAAKKLPPAGKKK